MTTVTDNWKTLLSLVIAFSGLVLANTTAWAHCDTESGPVAVDARKALETGTFKTVAIWVGEEQSDELRSAFDQSLPVYQMGGKAAKLAEQYFMETAVRLHRQAEGFPYTGLKPAQPLPLDVATAERALETGDIEPVLELLEAELRKKVTALFDEARAARKEKEKSLDAGREWADAYVEYVIFGRGSIGSSRNDWWNRIRAWGKRSRTCSTTGRN